MSESRKERFLLRVTLSNHHFARYKHDEKVDMTENPKRLGSNLKYVRPSKGFSQGQVVDIFAYHPKRLRQNREQNLLYRRRGSRQADDSALLHIRSTFGKISPSSASKHPTPRKLQWKHRRGLVTMGHIMSSSKEATRLHRKTITADQNATNFQNDLRQYFRLTRTQSYITYDDFIGHVFEPKGKTQRQQARSIMTSSFIMQPRYN